jgi:UDPglucose 6-dehydrogenase
MKNTVTIYGAGYVGLVTGVCLAEIGNYVLLVDTQQDKIADVFVLYMNLN